MTVLGPCLYFNTFDNKPTFVRDCFQVDQTTSPSQINIQPINDCNYLDIKIYFNKPTYYYPYLVSFLTNTVPDKVLHMDFGYWIYKQSQWTSKDFDTTSGAVEKLEYHHFQLMTELLKTILQNNGQHALKDLMNFEMMHRGFEKPTDEYLMRWRHRIISELYLPNFPSGDIDITNINSTEFVSMDPTIPHRCLHIVNSYIQQRSEVKDVAEYVRTHRGGIA